MGLNHTNPRRTFRNLHQNYANAKNISEDALDNSVYGATSELFSTATRNQI